MLSNKVLKLISSTIKKKYHDSSVDRYEPYFDQDYYFQNNLDIYLKNLDPLDHFINYGQFESRDPARTISAEWIQFKYSKLTENPYRLIYESIVEGTHLSPNPLFDSSFYLNQIGGVSKLQGLAAYDHYLQIGIYNNLRPNSWLDLESFADSNPWFFAGATSNFERFVNLFEIVRRNEIFNEYVCFTVENFAGEKFQLTSELFEIHLKKTSKFPIKSDRHNMSGWEVIEEVYNLANGNFSELEEIDLVKNYPPKLIDHQNHYDQIDCTQIVSYCHWSINGEVAEWINKALITFKSLGFQIVFNTNVALPSLPKFVTDNCAVVIQRTNSGHDFESHQLTKEWMDSNKIKVNKLILTNDSHFFPVSNISLLEDLLQNSPSKFWGLTENLWAKTHLQSYFLVLEDQLIDNYFEFIKLKLSVWKYISKSGLINNVELNSHDFAAQYEVKPAFLFQGLDPTFNSWDKLQEFGVPILKIHLIRKLLTTSPGDGDLLAMKLNKTFKESMITSSEMIEHGRQAEVLSKSNSYWYNNS